MLEKILEAIEQKNYQTAEELIQNLSTQNIDNLWVEYCYAYLEENKNDLEKALEKYRKILQALIYPNPKLMLKIRDGIERINSRKKEEKEKEKEREKEEKVNEIKSIPNSTELAVLILEPIEVTKKKEASQKMAKIMEIDIYSANLQIPTRNWRLFRIGNLGELTYYETQLKQAFIPCFCIAIKEINKIKIYQVKYIKSISPELVLLCKNNLQEENITINYSEISNRIEGLLPLFDASVHINNKGETARKKQTFDYAKFYDLHYKNKNIILRFSDYNYEFNQGINFTQEAKTANSKWNKLSEFFKQKMSNIPIHSDFTLFGESVVGFPEMLKQIHSHVKLIRREETPWDAAFQLYSGLIFLKN